jgi:hypothetical protein
MRIIYRPQSISLPSGIRREAKRRVEQRPVNFDELFDSEIFLYDTFVQNKNLYLIGPPLFNVTTFVDWNESLGKASLVSNAVGHLDKCLRVVACDWFESELAFPKLGLKISTKEPSDFSHIFRNERVLFAISKDNNIDWIRDWACFHLHTHGASGLLIYDNGSSKYSVQELLAGLADLPFRAVVVVAWPFKFGPQGGGGLQAPWDSNFCQHGAFEHARWRFLSDAASALNSDIDELVLNPCEKSVFEAAEAGTGLISYRGRWILPLAKSFDVAPSVEERRHRDFSFYERDRSKSVVSTTKYCFVPSRLDLSVQCANHNVVDVKGHTRAYDRTDQAEAEFYFAHFRAINTNWHWTRDVIRNVDASALEFDALLVRRFNEIHWPAPFAKVKRS